MVNALSKKCKATVKREGKVYFQEYEIGIAKTPLNQIGETEETGTQIQFYPDADIFVETKFDAKIIDES